MCFEGLFFLGASVYAVPANLWAVPLHPLRMMTGGGVFVALTSSDIRSSPLSVADQMWYNLQSFGSDGPAFYDKLYKERKKK